MATFTNPWDKSTSTSSLNREIDKTGFGKTKVGNVTKNLLSSGGVVDAVEGVLTGFDPTKIGTADTSKSTAAIEDTQYLNQGFLNAIGQQARPAPAQVVSNQINRADAGQIFAPTISGNVPQIGMQNAAPAMFANAGMAQAGQVGAPGMAFGGMAQAQMANPFLANNGAAQFFGAQAGQAGPITVQDQMTMQSRGSQMDALEMARQAALGNTPSAAQMQLQSGFDRAIAGQMAMLASQRGGFNPAAQRAAQFNAADLTSTAARESAMLRANESAQARSQFLDAAGQLRNADGSLAVAQGQISSSLEAQNAQLASQAALQNAQNAGQTSQFNAGMQTDVSKFNAGMQSDASKFNTGMQADLSKFNVGNQTDLSKFNSAQSFDANKFNVGQANDVSKFNVGNQTDVSKFNAGQANTIAISDADRAAATDRANQAATMAGLTADQNAQMQAALANQGVDLQVLISNAQRGDTAALANMDAALKMQGMNDEMSKAYISAATNTNQQVLNARMEEYRIAQDLEKAKTEAKSKATGGVIGAIGSIFGMKSDEKAKKNIKKEDKEIRNFLDALEACSYDYKDQKDGAGRKYGIMAQAMEKSKAGSTAVIQTKEGKMIEPKALFGLLTASLADTNKRLKELEKGKKS